eukprot:7386912-Prymnesium_polylepis.1
MADGCEVERVRRRDERTRAAAGPVCAGRAHAAGSPPPPAGSSPRRAPRLASSRRSPPRRRGRRAGVEGSHDAGLVRDGRPSPRRRPVRAH